MDCSCSEVTEEMVSAGVFALERLCPFDVAFPIGGEREAVAAVLEAALTLRVQGTTS